MRSLRSGHRTVDSDRPVAGQDLFEFYCASCHGRGRGAGRVAPALKVPPPDLTTLAQKNRGTFPATRVEGVLKGEAHLSTPAHGASDMPVWGPIFKGLDSRDEVNEQRISRAEDARWTIAAALLELGEAMSPDAIAEARRQAREWAAAFDSRHKQPD